MDPTDPHSRKRDRPQDDEEKVDSTANNRQRTSLANGLAAPARNDADVMSQFILNPRLQLLNTAFQLQQTPQQLATLALNAGAPAAQQPLRPNVNPFAGLQGLQQLHPRTTAPLAPDLIETLQVRLLASANSMARVGSAPVGNGILQQMSSSLPTNATAASSANGSTAAILQQTSPAFCVPSSTAAAAVGAGPGSSLQALPMAPHPMPSQSMETNGSTNASQPSDINMDALLVCAEGQKLLFTPDDEWKLSPYQCLARKQIELFEASEKDLEAGAQGRNRPIVLKQLGIRCRWCAHLASRQRQRASAYYPSKLEGIYQAAQNISNSHLSRLCQSVPPIVRQELVRLQAKKSGAGGGKKYWSQSAKEQGVYDVEDGGLRLASSSLSASSNMTTTSSPPGDTTINDDGEAVATGTSPV